MITYDEAYDRMMAAVTLLPAETVALSEATGRILAEDIASDIDMPPFDKSAMDGYACRRADLAKGQLTVIEEIPAGAWPQKHVTEGTCARILTGAPLPLGADCVLMQEQTQREGDLVRIHKTETSDNLCRRAEDIRTGDVVLRRGERIAPAQIAVLATVGATRPSVIRQPHVAILATGSELVEPDARPSLAQIRNSNSWQLAAQVRAMGALPSYSGILEDREDIIAAAIEEAMLSSDLLLLSGGVSTGDYDLVPGILQKLGFTFSFDSVAMQPGRPTVFGRKGQIYCCGLPGNPVSTYVIFEILVKPFLYRLMGHDWQPLLVEARLSKPIFRRKAQRQANIPVRFLAPDLVEPIEYHGSAHINAMTQAQGIICIPVGQTTINEGECVRVRSFSA